MILELRHGSTRTVILTQRYAIKIPSFVEWRLFLHGLLGNMQERMFSRQGWPKLCPVVFSIPGGWLLVMKRADPLSHRAWAEFDYDRFVDCQDYVIPVENKYSSFGIIDRRIVAVDYGS